MWEKSHGDADRLLEKHSGKIRAWINSVIFNSWIIILMAIYRASRKINSLNPKIDSVAPICDDRHEVHSGLSINSSVQKKNSYIQIDKHKTLVCYYTRMNDGMYRPLRCGRQIAEGFSSLTGYISDGLPAIVEAICNQNYRRRLS